MHLNTVIKYNLMMMLENGLCLEEYTDKAEELTLQEKFQMVYNIYQDEFCHPSTVLRYPSEKERLAEWLKGLPSVINFPFYNYDIEQIGIKLGVKLDYDSDVEKFLGHWFYRLATLILQMKNIGPSAEKNYKEFKNSGQYLLD